MTKWEGTELPSFTDPNGNPVQRGRDAIFAWGGSQARPVIDKSEAPATTRSLSSRAHSPRTKLAGSATCVRKAA